MDPDLEATLEVVGERLRQMRAEHGLSLSDLSEQTGISRSTLSRLETGERRPTLEVLLILSRNYRISLDDMISGAGPEDPRIHPHARRVHGKVVLPLSRPDSEVQVFKIDIPASSRAPRRRSHEGFDWIYVLHGKLRLLVGEQDLILTEGEAAEFDTRAPHWFGSTGDSPVEILSMFSRQGERMHVKDGPHHPSSGNE